jgi:putative membrane protein
MSRSLRLLALGAIGGLIAAWAMEESQKAIAQAAQAAGATPPSGEPATVKAADRVAIAFTGHPVADAKRLGVVYTLLADVLPGITAGFGGLFGLAVSLGLDEAAVPALGLSPPASHVPAERHAEGIGAHIIYGAALEAARRTLMIAA